jgi:hypothetical protein
MVLRAANVRVTRKHVTTGRLPARLELLTRINSGQMLLLTSEKLLHQYNMHVRPPYWDYIKLFFEVIIGQARSTPNWTIPWSTGRQADARKCRFPSHDDLLLRTAILPNQETVIFTEEAKLISTDACIHRRFGVHVRYP